MYCPLQETSVVFPFFMASLAIIRKAIKSEPGVEVDGMERNCSFCWGGMLKMAPWNRRFLISLRFHVYLSKVVFYTFDPIPACLITTQLYGNCNKPLQGSLATNQYSGMSTLRGRFNCFLFYVHLYLGRWSKLTCAYFFQTGGSTTNYQLLIKWWFGGLGTPRILNHRAPKATIKHYLKNCPLSWFQPLKFLLRLWSMSSLLKSSSGWTAILMKLGVRIEKTTGEISGEKLLWVWKTGISLQKMAMLNKIHVEFQRWTHWVPTDL